MSLIFWKLQKYHILLEQTNEHLQNIYNIYRNFLLYKIFSKTIYTITLYALESNIYISRS